MWPNEFMSLNDLDQLLSSLGIESQMGPRQTAAILYESMFNVNEKIDAGRFSTDLGEILDRLNINAYYVDMSEVFPEEENANKKISACITIEDGERVIYVNKYDSPLRQRFSIAHEIGHYVLRHLDEDGEDILYRDPNSSTGSDSREIMANRFASSLLLPKQMVEDMYKRGFSMEMMADAFGVSISVVKYRLINLKLR